MTCRNQSVPAHCSLGNNECCANVLPSFKYKPLDLKANSIRLLRVLPTHRTNGLLELELWHSALPAGYRCLSYMWGTRTKSHRILLNGHVFSVGDNLHSFLKEVSRWSRRGFSEPLWIDAICIDQESVVERGHQVQRMGDIYASAQEVYVWLGDRLSLEDPLYDWLHSENRDSCPVSLNGHWHAIRFHPYWCRAWIMQEILLAKSVSVLFPGKRVAWTIMGHAIAKSGDLHKYESESAAHLWSLWGARWPEKPGQERQHNSANGFRDQNELFSFWYLIHVHRASVCTDRRDRLYSLLGLVDEKHGFTVDYSESTADLFWRAGEHFGAWAGPELVDILRSALLQDEVMAEESSHTRSVVDPRPLVSTLENSPGRCILVPVRRATSISAFSSRFIKRARCMFRDCQNAPRLRCSQYDILICTNARSYDRTEHGCIHGIAHQIDRPAAEPFKITITAHHGKDKVTTVLPSTALHVHDAGTDSWVGVSTWSSLQRALGKNDLDRCDRVKLSVPARYAIWIWFGVHPDQLSATYDAHEHETELPSAHHALPSGTKVTKDSIELPAL